MQALILGEHGDSMVPIWSSATVAGLPLEQWPGFDADRADGGLRGDEDGRRRRSSSSRAAPASPSACRSARWSTPLALDSRRVLPVSTLQQGLYGVRDVCLSVPTVVGCGGVGSRSSWLTPKERLGLQNSARVLREIIDQVEARLGAAPAPAAALTRAARQRTRHPASRLAVSGLSDEP